MFSSSATVIHDREGPADYASSSVSNQRSNFSQKLSPCDIFSESRRYIDLTSDHRNNFKSFIHVYVGISDILTTCERSLQRLSETDDCQYGPSAVFCRMMTEYVQNLSNSVSAESVDEMRRMKTIVKEKLSGYDAEIKSRLKEVVSVKQSMDKLDLSLDRIQVDLRKVHASLSRVGGTVDKDKLFEKIQKLQLDQQKIVNDSEYELSQFMTKHLQAYNKVSSTVNELSSIRRRLNRKILLEIKNVTPKLQTGSGTFFENTVSAAIAQCERSLPSGGDFGMRLPLVEISVSALIGSDRDSKQRTIEVVEYRAVQTYIAKEVGELTFARNERIIVGQKENSGWWFGRNEKGQEGYFPSVLVCERPANVPLPTDAVGQDSYRPKLTSQLPNTTWKTANSLDERISLIQSHPEGTFSGTIHFPIYSDEICLETNDIVEIIKLGAEPGKVIVKNDRNQIGSIPLNIVTVKYANENTCNN